MTPVLVEVALALVSTVTVRFNWEKLLCPAVGLVSLTTSAAQRFQVCALETVVNISVITFTIYSHHLFK